MIASSQKRHGDQRRRQPVGEAAVGRDRVAPNSGATKMSMSGMLAAMISAGMARGLRRLSPMRPSRQPTSDVGEIVQSSRPRINQLVRLLFDLPGLALGDQRLEVGGLARGGGLVLLDHRAFEGRRRVLVDDAERDREAVGHFDQHRRDALVLRVVDETAGSSPSTTFSASRSHVEREALGAAREQHLLARLEPQLLVRGDVALGEAGEHVVVIDDAILVDFDEARAAVRVRGLEHVGQVLVDVDAAGDEPRARAQARTCTA